MAVVMRSLSVGTTFTIDAPVDTVAFIRLRPSDHAPSSEHFTASHGGAMTTACLDVLLDGRWWALDACMNDRRIGWIPIARDRDALDIPFVSTLGVVSIGNVSVYASEPAAPKLVSVGC